MIENTGDLKKSGLQPWQYRVISELAELGIKLYDLHRFMESQFFAEMSDDDKAILRRQALFMDDYYDTLGERISKFPGN